MTIRRFYAPPQNFSAGLVTLTEDETHHLRDVLRLKVKDDVNVFDGEGREFACRIASIEKRSASLSIVSETDPSSSESPLDLTIAAVLLKGDKLDISIQKAVELGVNRFIPMTSIRCDVKVRGDSKRSDRWRRIALEATKQCGRARLMEIDDITAYDNVLLDGRADDTPMIHFSERDGKRFDEMSSSNKLLAFIGPEGGWDDSELEAAKTAGVLSITFGGRILKADTAAISIATILQHRFGDIN